MLVGDVLRGRRKALGLSQKALAVLADCSVSTIRLVEAGWRPSDEMLNKLQHGLDSAPRLVDADILRALRQAAE